MITLFWCLVWVLAGIAAHFLLTFLHSARRRAIANVCLIYLLLLGLFAHLYYYLYQTNQSRFAFAKQILSARRTELGAARKAEIDRLNKLTAAVAFLADRLSHMQVPIRLFGSDSSLVVIDLTEYHYTLKFDPTWTQAETGNIVRGAEFVVSDKGGSTLGSERVFITGPDLSLEKTLSPQGWSQLVESYFPPRSPENIKDVLYPLRARLERLLEDLERIDVEAREHEEHLNEPLQRIQEWTYWDFLYFSTITQATVGYGDILPNCTGVRIWVLIQVLLGLFLLGIAISWIAVEQRGALNASPQGDTHS